MEATPTTVLEMSPERPLLQSLVGPLGPRGSVATNPDRTLTHTPPCVRSARKATGLTPLQPSMLLMTCLIRV